MLKACQLQVFMTHGNEEKTTGLEIGITEVRDEAAGFPNADGNKEEVETHVREETSGGKTHCTLLEALQAVTI